MEWLIILGLLAGWLLFDGRKRGRRFVKSVIFLDTLDCGESVDAANRLAANFGRNPDVDRRSIDRADLIRRGVFNGKQLPAIEMARAKGFSD